LRALGPPPRPVGNAAAVASLDREAAVRLKPPVALRGASLRLVLTHARARDGDLACTAPARLLQPWATYGYGLARTAAPRDLE
jgi:hypothetical protein